MRYLVFLVFVIGCFAQDYPKIMVDKLTENRFILRNDSIILKEQKPQGIPVSILTVKEKQEMTRIYQYDLENKQQDRVKYMRYLNREISGVTWTPPVYSGYFIIRNDKIRLIDKSKFYWADSTRGSLTTSQSQYWSLFEFKMAERDTGYVGTLSRGIAPNRIYWLVIWPYVGIYPYSTIDQLRTYLNDLASVPRWTNGL